MIDEIIKNLYLGLFIKNEMIYCSLNYYKDNQN